MAVISGMSASVVGRSTSSSGIVTKVLVKKNAAPKRRV
jgi:hypothetical protein